MTMTKKIRDWETLPQFISWEHYDAMSTGELAQLCDSMRDQIAAITSQMDRAELIVGRSARAKAMTQARSLHARLSDLLKSRT